MLDDWTCDIEGNERCVYACRKDGVETLTDLGVFYPAPTELLLKSILVLSPLNRTLSWRGIELAGMVLFLFEFNVWVAKNGV